MELKEEYFDMARAYRFDYMPHFDEGERPELDGLLMYAFVMGNYPKEMTFSFVEDISAKYFGVLEVEHASTKEWEYSDGKYTATPWSYRSEPFMELISYGMVPHGERKDITVVMREYGFASRDALEDQNDIDITQMHPFEDQAVVETMKKTGKTFVEAAKEMIANGDTDAFYKTRTYVYTYITEKDGVTPARFLCVGYLDPENP